MQTMNERVVITGMGILCALGNEYGPILKQMKQKKSGISNVERFHTDKFQSHIGAEVKNYRPEDYFNAAQIQQYDHCAQYAIIAANKAIKDSQLEITSALKARVGLALGTCNGGILSLEAQGSLKNLDHTRTARYPYYQQGDDVAAYLDVHGPVITMNTACAASGNAIGFGYDMIRTGYAGVMLAGGSDPLSHTVYAGFNVLRALNPVPASPYSNRYGLSLGEGASFVVLESMQHALDRGAPIYAEVCGYGMSNDAYHATASDPEGKGIQIAVKMALHDSEVNKEEIGYINAHGTGTKVNDIAEINGLRSVFGNKALANIPLNSSKAYFGHNLGAAAAIELTTALYAIEQGWLPATLHHESTRDGCEGVNIIANEMIESSPEFMLCNNSAFGGHNSSIITRTGKFVDRHNVKPTSSLKKRVGIVGMGQVSPLGSLKGSLYPSLNQSNPSSEFLDFSLKEYDPTLYDRRMNRLCQYSIASGHLAMQDAGWTIDEEKGEEIGLIYGTSRGSLDSIDKYLSSVFDDGPEFASSIHFPFNVVNSTSGKMAQKLRLKGFSSSISTGGNDGLMSVLYGYETILRNVHKQCLVGAGDELSGLSTKINEAKGLQRSRFTMVEGSSCMAIADLSMVQEESVKVYAEIEGIGLSFHGSGVQDGTGLIEAITQALERANLSNDCIDFVMLNSLGRPDELELEQRTIRGLFKRNQVSIECYNHLFGYGESLSSLQHLSLAADHIFHSEKRLHHGLVVSSSVNGSNIAIILSKINHTEGREIS